MEPSEKYSLNRVDRRKILVGAGMAMGGALVTYLLSILGYIDFGPYTPLIVSVASILLNALRKYFNGQNNNY